MIKKKVCLVSFDYPQYGGLNAVLNKKAKELSQIYDLSILSHTESGKDHPMNEVLSYDVLINGSTSIRNDLIRTLRPAIRYFNDNKIDVAILMGNYTAFMTSVIRPFVKTKFVFADHGALMNQWDDKKLRIMKYIAAKLCNKVITLTEQTRQDYIEKFNINPKKINCIHNWIEISNDCSSQYEINSKRIISAGRMTSEKGFDMLIKAFAPVAKKHPDWQLDLYGDGEMMDTVKSLISEFGIEQNVNLLGMCNNLAQQYKNYAFYVLPSYREGLPLVLLEAKSNLLPIVSFDVTTGPREIIRDGVDGILVPPRDIEKLGNEMCYLIENPEVRAQMSAAALDNIDKFSKDTILAQWVELIESF